MAIEVRVDDGLCAGARRCVHLAPEAFSMTPTGVAEVRDAGALPEEALLRVAAECPNEAIVVVRDGRPLSGAPADPA